MIKNKKFDFFKKYKSNNILIQIFLVLFLIIVSYYFVLFILFGIGYVTTSIFIDEFQLNPIERNYLEFKDEPIGNILDSIKKLESIFYASKFPKDVIINISISDSSKKIYKISNDELTDLEYNQLLYNKYNIDINSINSIDSFLKSNYIIPYHYYKNKRCLLFDYKPFELMYKINNIKHDLSRRIIYYYNYQVYINTEPNFTINFKVLDYYKNLQLVASRNSKIWGDSIPYTVNYKKE